ncbi:unnamed protein product [Clavelina lepadiformis]|uniref:Uncharacterized protein n=1 Tax=Clavelina lepadiformis TaxID=159417 RepID=A0ABP0FV87_CLALP
MMNVKDRYSGINMRDECRQTWTKNCTSFKKLNETCDIISSCAWSGGRGRTQKLTNKTAEAFVLSTRANIEAAELLLTQHNFIYVLPGVFADEALASKPPCTFKIRVNSVRVSSCALHL